MLLQQHLHHFQTNPVKKESMLREVCIILSYLFTHLSVLATVFFGLFRIYF